MYDVILNKLTESNIEYLNKNRVLLYIVEFKKEEFFFQSALIDEKRIILDTPYGDFLNQEYKFPLIKPTYYTSYSILNNFSYDNINDVYFDNSNEKYLFVRKEIIDKKPCIGLVFCGKVHNFDLFINDNIRYYKKINFLVKRYPFFLKEIILQESDLQNLLCINIKKIKFIKENKAI